MKSVGSILFISMVGLAAILAGCSEAPLDEVSAPASPASSVTGSPAYLSFPGTSTANLAITADGVWTLESDSPWLQVSDTHGSGDADVTVTVDRAGLEPGSYAGSLLLEGAEPEGVVTVLMRFPTVFGGIGSDTDQLLSTAGVSLARAPAGVHVPDEVIVQLDAQMVALAQGAGAHRFREASAALSMDALGRAAEDLSRDYGLRNAVPIARESATFVMKTDDPRAAIIDLQRDGRVARAAPNQVYVPYGEVNDPYYGAQWHYENINLEAAWDLTLGSPDVVVAVIDSAIDTRHPDLLGQWVDGFDFATNTIAIDTPADLHGTHVAGTIAAATGNSSGGAGVTPRAKVMPLNVFNDGFTTETDVARALYYAAGGCPYLTDGTVVCGPVTADVVNMSLGPSNPYCEPLPRSVVLEESQAFAMGRGVTLVAAAGNDACNVLGGPAASPTTMAVSATAPTDGRASYSNYGNDIWIAAPGGDQAATGRREDGVLSTVPGGYAYLQGTSMASPHVAGVAALVLAANPDLLPSDVAGILAATARDVGLTGPDTYFGYGIVDAEAAVTLARASLRAYYSDIIVRLDGDSRDYEARAANDAVYEIENVAAGTYTLEAGDDWNRDGKLGDPGEFYFSATIVVDYGGDVRRSISVDPR